MRAVRVSGAGLALAMALSSLACGPREAAPRLAPRLRLVEVERTVEPAPCCDAAQADAVAPPLARIGAEGRPVLRAFSEAFLGRGVARRVAGSDRPALWLPLPPGLQAAPGLHVRPEIAPRARAGWTPRPSRQLAVGRFEGTPAVRIELSGDDVSGAAPLWVRAWARVPADGGRERIETGPREVPPDAWLEWGFGLLPDTTAPGDVLFRVSACRDAACTTLLETALASDAPAAWHDRRASLAEFAGQRISFRFDAQWDAAGGGVAFPLWSDPTVVAPDPGPAGPSLLLVSLDTLRADRLPAYGYPLATAPFLSGFFGRDGTLFERAVAPADMTGPSHLTLFTSLQPSVHGLRSHVRPHALPGAVQTLAGVLRAHGFTTGAVTEDGALAFGRGIERGFGRYREHRTQESGGSIEATLAEGREWLERHGDRRFFLFLHSYEVHTPYRVPERYPRLGYANEAIRERWQGRPIRPDWDPLNYDREIAQADAALRGFLEALEREGRLADTLVVVLADHGEAFLEHDAMHHAGVLEESVLHVPLLLRGPGVARGRRVDAPVGLVDVMPTLLELLGVADPGQGMGRSFAELVREGAPAPAGQWRARPLFSESWSDSRTEWREGRLRRVDVEPPGLAVRRGAYRLVRDVVDGKPRERFFDLGQGADAPVDLPATDPAAASALRALADAYPATMQAQREALLSGGSPEPQPLPLDAEQEDALRALGYLE